MSVLVFMFHGTPLKKTENIWDVAMPTFRDQIRYLLDERCEFIKFSETTPEHYYNDSIYVSLTFDDGNLNNFEAFSYLHSIGITPTAFIVRDWVGRPEMLTEDTIAQLAGSCEFGGHGTTHRGLTDLSYSELVKELADSRSYLERLLDQRIDSMSAPGGRISKAVVDVARACGFNSIGNSVPFINYRPGATINRICVRNGDGAEFLAEMARASRFFWLWRRGRRSVLNASQYALGSSNFERIKTFASRLRK